jgi:hypothetical protein
MKSAIRLASLVSILAMFCAGCGSDNPVAPSATQTSDQSDMIAALSTESQLVDDGLFNSSVQTSLSGARPGVQATGNTAIEPLRFWRTISSARRTFDFAFSDTDTTGRPTVAVVTIHWHFAGTFNVVPAGEDGLPDLNNVVHKPLSDHSIRRVRFRRTTTADDPTHDRWRIAAVTGVDVTSKDVTSQILSVRLQTATFDSTIVDPLAFFNLRHILRFASGDSVTITVTTSRSDDVVLLYHADHRRRMTNNGDNTYTGTLHVGTLDGWRHFGVNALSHGTLYDDTLPYDSKAWLFPYVVETTPAVDYLP